MLGINMSDVINLVMQIIPQLTVLGVVLLSAIVITIAVLKLPRGLKRFVRTQAWTAVLATFLVVCLLVASGPMARILTLASGAGPAPSAATIKETTEVAHQIADEGVVLLENAEGVLPLASKKVNVFGWASIDPVYGGTGSGSMNANYPTVSLLEGLKNAGLEVNDKLSELYTNYMAKRPKAIHFFMPDWSLPEAPASSYTSEVMKQAQDFSDTAVIVISRSGGEFFDLPVDMTKVQVNYTNPGAPDFEAGQHYLELSRSEREMIETVCKNFEKVVVLYNGANAMPLGWVKDYPQIKGAVWFPGAGQVGFDAVGRALSGDINPSGRTSDTFLYDLRTAPWWNHFGNFSYTNADEFQIKDFMTKKDIPPTFVQYNEGIYVGYRFWETAHDEGLLDYKKHVQYPFGYGLSYTTFEKTMSAPQVASDGTVTVEVNVTNTGSVAGKETVQLYSNPPYTNGGIEKASANLVTFAKTKELKAGESEKVILTFKLEDLASYDNKAEGGKGAWVLEAGNYKLSVRNNSHDIVAEHSVSVPETVVYGAQNARSTDKVAAQNQFADAEGTMPFLSRANHFANYEEAIKAPQNTEMSAETKAIFTNTASYDPSKQDDPKKEMPKTGVKGSLKLKDLRGASYDDPRWEQLLDQMTTDEMNALIGYAGYATPAVESVGKVGTTDLDGPMALNNNFTGKGSIAVPPSTTVACTWNADLAHKLGQQMGKMAVEMRVAGWYAPSMNIHRSQLAGRNFEYYSEDGVLAGVLAANTELGASEHGVYGYIKHFAMNEQEVNRMSMLCTWSTEQAIREIYLKPFELSVKQGKAAAVMTAFNYIGPTWAGAHSGLLNEVLRNEWGFRGFTLTDYFGGAGYMNMEQAVRNGGDAALATANIGTNAVTKLTPSGVEALRTASKNIMYTTVNSVAYSEKMPAQGLYMWQMVAIGVGVAGTAIIALIEWRAIRKFLAYRREAEKSDE